MKPVIRTWRGSVNTVYQSPYTRVGELPAMVAEIRSMDDNYGELVVLPLASAEIAGLVGKLLKITVTVEEVR